MTRLPPPGSGAYGFGHREAWQNANEIKSERAMGEYTVDEKMARFCPVGSGVYGFGHREGWQNINETKPERHMSQYTVDDSGAMAQKSPRQFNMVSAHNVCV
jgi:hypothetical protein